MAFPWKVFHQNFWRRTLSLTRVNSRLSGCAANTIKILPPFNPPTPTASPDPPHYLPPLPSPSFTPPTCDSEDLREFTCNSSTHLAFLSSELMIAWLHPRWPYYKSVSDTVHVVEWGLWRGGQRKENGSTAGFLSGRHRSRDVTNAVNGLACLQ